MARRDVDTQGHIGFWCFEQAIGDHCECPPQVLLSGLEHELDRAPNLVAVAGQDGSHANPNRNVGVMATCVHHAGVLRAVGDVILLMDRERIHVEAEQHRTFARQAPLEEPNHASLTNAGLYLIPQGAELLGDKIRRTVLLKAQFGMHVEVAPDRYELVVERFGLSEEWCSH
jgi:hypothetical protein